jgi:hypothetical protein
VSVLEQIQALEAQREQLNADIDKQLAGLRAQGLQEMQKMQQSLTELQLALRVAPVTRETVPPRSRAEIDETDAGNGMREIEENMSAQSFKDELAVLRERTQMRRRRL